MPRPATAPPAATTPATATTTQAFVVDETNGSWGKTIEVPGTATLNSGGDAEVNSVSCATAGDCAAGGYYKDGSGNYQAFVVDETNGSWGNTIEVPGTATLNSGGDANVESVSCATAGTCTAGGHYADGSSHLQAFVVDETNGSWGTAQRSARHGEPQRRRQRRGALDLVCDGRQLRRRRLVHGQREARAGIRCR